MSNSIIIFLLTAFGIVTIAYAGLHLSLTAPTIERRAILGVLACGGIVLIYGALSIDGLGVAQSAAFKAVQGNAAARIRWAARIEVAAARQVHSSSDALEEALKSSDGDAVLAKVTAVVNELVPISPSEREANLKNLVSTAMREQGTWREAYKTNQAAYKDRVENTIGGALLVKLGMFAAQIPDWDENQQGCDQRKWNCENGYVWPTPQH